jgi:histidinol-phosphate aminotransferase
LITGERRHLQRGIRAMRDCTTDGHANFVYLLEQGRAWRQAFEDAGLHFRHYHDEGVRITVGDRCPPGRYWRLSRSRQR